ncbi:uncharacterized protein AB675_6668 [Cyphellophora attinorum]|uniref:Uncharacterized protein n=1 Tax=Cyphellophora attinorum TaxID=1664694 RepID=A0A0N0NPW3_9EURO|nr:uncharacterized protein AB675_6668 [Phialophora attinorum]KPI43198.1 hypothetical protein AB675_6668 [Phialophora attinorum]
MSGLDPSGPSQPTQQQGLNQAGNPADKTSAEGRQHKQATSDVPSTHDGEARPSALGAGDTGALKEKDISRSDAHPYSKDGNLEGEQMRAPGEGDVAEAVRSGGGGGHLGQEDLMSDMDRKAKDHELELKKRGERTGKEIEEEEKEDWTNKRADVGEALAATGTPVVLAPEGAS